MKALDRSVETLGLWIITSLNLSKFGIFQIDILGYQPKITGIQTTGENKIWDI